jgi:hypothetical protein
MQAHQQSAEQEARTGPLQSLKTCCFVAGEQSGDNKGSGDSYAVIDDRKIGTDQPYPDAIVKENPTEIPIKVSLHRA